MTHSSGILVFVRTKHTGGSYEPLQTSYTIRARKANVFFGKGLQHETYCQRAWAQCICFCPKTLSNKFKLIARYTLCTGAWNVGGGLFLFTFSLVVV